MHVGLLENPIPRFANTLELEVSALEPDVQIRLIDASGTVLDREELAPQP